MATIQWSALVSQMKGKLRGDVIQNSQAGQILRTGNRGKSLRPGATESVRLNVMYLSSQWSQLGISDRNAWAAMTASYPTTTRFGASRTPSAYNLFSKLNLALLNAGQAILTVPAAPVSLTDISTCTVNNTSFASMSIDFPMSFGADEFVIVQASRACSAGRSKPINGYAVIEVTNVSTAPFVRSYTGQYRAVFSINPVGSQIFYRLRVINISTGQVGLPLVLPFIVS